VENVRQIIGVIGKNCAREVIPLSKWLVGKKAVANALGMSVSTVGRYMNRYQDFPAHRRGGTIFVSPAALVAWIEHREIEKHPTCGVVTPRGTR
jgi:predicted DNA-binding transcriptional regulator AlpA